VIANFIIENQGYAGFEINKSYLSAVVNGKTYNYDPSRCVNDVLADIRIEDGGTVKGNVPFQLPNLTMDPDIVWQYTGSANYNIEWIDLDQLTPKVTETAI
jgi:hypothetical protein